MGVSVPVPDDFLGFRAAEHMAGVLGEVVVEREHQIASKDYTPEHDDEHDPNDFAGIIRDLAMGQGWWDDPRKSCIQIAAVAVAAVESMDRKKPKGRS